MFQRDGNGPMRQPVQEIGCAVQRIDNPAACRVLPCDTAFFLGQPAIGRTRAKQFFLEDFLGCQICAADEIAGTFHRHLQVLDLAEILDKRSAGLAGSLDHDVEICAALHGLAPVCQGARIRARLPLAKGRTPIRPICEIPHRCCVALHRTAPQAKPICTPERNQRQAPHILRRDP